MNRGVRRIQVECLQGGPGLGNRCLMLSMPRLPCPARSARSRCRNARRFAALRAFGENKLAVAGLVVVAALLRGGAVCAADLALRPARHSAGRALEATHGRTLARHGPQQPRRICPAGDGNARLAGRRVRGGGHHHEPGHHARRACGFFRWLDRCAVMRFTDILLSIPQLLLLISAGALFRGRLNPIITTVLVIGLTSWPGAARLIRGQFLALKEQEFVTAARVIGASPGRSSGGICCRTRSPW